jgi:hypothetical protein
MSIDRYNNLMDGESIIVPNGTAISEVPDDFSSLLTENIIAAFSAPDAFFGNLVKQAQLPEFKQWLEMLANAGIHSLEIHTSEYVSSDTLLRFELPNGMSPAISLPSPESEVSLPTPLAEVHSLIGKIKHSDWEMAGGLLGPDSICSIGDMGTWLSDECDTDPSQCFAFYGSSYGDNGCFTADGSAFWYAHEIGNLIPSGNLNDFLKKYFRALLDGKESHPENNV